MLFMCHCRLWSICLWKTYKEGRLSTALSWRTDRYWGGRPPGAVVWWKTWLFYVFFLPCWKGNVV